MRDFLQRHYSTMLLYLLASVIALIFLTPFFWLIFTSLKTQQEVYQFPLTILPQKPTFENYLYIFSRLGDFGRFFLNSVVVSAISVTAIVLLSSISGYALGRKNFLGRDITFTFVMLILTVPYVIYLIPIFLLEESLGIRNSYIGLILPYVALYLPWGLFLMRGSFKGVPYEMEDYAKIDGANDLQIWAYVLMPLVKPGVATTTIISFTFVWQEFLFAVSIQTESKWQTLPVGIVLIRDELQSMPYHNIATMIVVSLVPIFILFMIFKDFFIKGITEGAVKG